MFGKGDGVEPSDPDDAGKHIAKVPFLIRARSVVQVHPGPPFKYAAFLIFPLLGNLLQKTILPTVCQLHDWLAGSHCTPAHSEARSLS